jgi:hypothetical protein
MAEEFGRGSLEGPPLMLLDNALLAENHLGFSPCVTHEAPYENVEPFASRALEQSTSLPSQ